jgi:antitoxin HicB
MLHYTAILTPDPKSGYVVEFPDLPWAITQGETEVECMENAADVILATLEELMRRRAPLPRPKRHRGPTARQVPLPALVEAKLALYRALLSSGLSRAAFGRKLGLHPMQLDRLFDLRHASRIDQIESALRALDKRLIVGVQDAA